MNKKYNKKIEKEIYNIIREENPSFEYISRKLNIQYDDLKEYINKSSSKYKKSLVKKIRKAKDEYFLDAKIKIAKCIDKKSIRLLQQGDCKGNKN